MDSMMSRDLGISSWSWYLNVEKELIGLGAILCKCDPAVYIWHNQSKVNGLLCTHVDDFLFGGTELFKIKLLIQLNVSSQLDQNTVLHSSV